MTKLYIGVLSGTSMDAIDVAAIDFSSTLPKIVATLSVELPTEYKTSCLNIINSGKASIQELGELDHWIGKLFADAILKFLSHTKIAPEKISAIGSHGQTIWHSPNSEKPFTWQIGDPNIIAVKTGITTIADFRRADMAAGGQGAPLAPAFHQAVFASPTESRCIINIGGISNISILQDNKVIGFDVGPGNCLIDSWVKKHFNQEYDKDGAIAKTGTVSHELLATCLADPFFIQAAPKSSGREYFNDQWLKNKLAASKQDSLSPQDVLATLTQLTAVSIAHAVQRYADSKTKVFLCGGGAKNSTLCAALAEHLGQPVTTTAELGIDPAWLEAALFAWIAKQTLAGVAIDLPAITGAKKSVVAGGIYGYTKSKH